MSLSNEIWEIPAQASDVEGLDAQGRPDPAYAQALGLVPARPGMRVAATTLEAVVALAIAVPGTIAILGLVAQGASDPQAILARKDLFWALLPLIVSYALMLIFTVLQLILHGLKGVTLGKAAFGIRTINVRTLEKPGFWRGAVVRYLVLGASFLVPLIGPLLVIALSPLFDAERRGRGWPDRAAATWLVDVRRGLNPYDGKRLRIARKQITTEVHEAAPVLPSLATPIDRDAPAVYVPTGRFSGGVVGAHRAAPSARVGAVPEPTASAPDLAPSPSVAPLAPLAGAPLLGAPSNPTPPLTAPEPAPEPAPAPETAPAPEPEPAPEPTLSPARALLVLDDGTRVEVRGTTLIGRAPAAAPGEGGDDEPQLVSVADETRSVSKTHVAILLSRRGLVAVDRASTNGSSIVRDGSEHPLTPGHPTELRLGDTLRFGDRSLKVDQA